MIFCQLRRSKGPREPCPIMFSLWPHEIQQDDTEEDIHAVFYSFISKDGVFLIQLFEISHHYILYNRFFLWSHPTSHHIAVILELEVICNSSWYSQAHFSSLAFSPPLEDKLYQYL